MLCPQPGTRSSCVKPPRGGGRNQRRRRARGSRRRGRGGAGGGGGGAGGGRGGRARRGRPEATAAVFGIEADTVAQILADERAYLLAVLCKGARASRATFSALALLTDSGDAGGKSYARLAVYDGVAQTGSEALLRFWQAQARAHVTSPKAA